MPHLVRLTPMLSVADLRRTITFYCDELGFRCVRTFGNPDPAWCHLERDGIALMFNQPPADELRDVPARAKDFQVFYCYADDVRGLHAQWTAKSLPVTPLRETDYQMQEFELRDPDGYWLWFGEPSNEPPQVSG